MGNLPKILIVDDEEYTRAFFKEALSDDYAVSLSHSAEDALEKWKKESFSLIILDVVLPGIDGIEALRQIRENDAETLIIMISAHGDMDTAIEMMRLGANDFIKKPFSSAKKINLDIGKRIERYRFQNRDERSEHKMSPELTEHSMIYVSKEMEQIVGIISRAATVDLPVLILGESGTGKELVARAIHANSSRKNSLFFSVNCGALAENLLESTLFGYEKGAFTGAFSTRMGYFEAAEDGTIFLDEVAETSPAFQVKLLRVLQDGVIMRVGGTKPISINVRLISATNADLGFLIKADKFRKDLFYRINVINIELPPLRQRKSDIPVLFEHFLKNVCERNKIEEKQIQSDLIEHLKELSWEGNVRELRNLAERLAVLSNETVITYNDLPSEYKQVEASHKNALSPKNYNQAKVEFEKKYINSLLEHTGKDLKRATAISGLSLVTIYRKKNKLMV